MNISNFSNSKKISLALLFVSVFCFYLWTASNGYFSSLSPTNTKPSFNKTAFNYYDFLLADAFLDGQTHLKIKPSPRLLALSDPYDVSQNRGYKLLDASLYKGNYFLYFSPVIALLFIAPFKWISGYYLPISLIIPLLCFIGFVFSYCCFIKLLRIASVSISFPLLCTSTLILATATTLPFLLRRIAIYESVIVASYAFLMIGLYFFISAVTEKQKKTIFMHSTAAGIFLGLCMLSRPNQLLTCSILIFAFPIIRHYLLHDNVKTVIFYFLLLALPIFLIGLTMLWYNYIRFDNILEFGTSYQLLGHRAGPFGFNQQNIISLWYYLFNPINFNKMFPFIHTNKAIYGAYSLEPVIGFIALPVYWLIFSAVPYIRTLFKQCTVTMVILLPFLISGLSISLSVCFIPMATLRYFVDFSPLFLLPTLFLLSSCQKYINNLNILSKATIHLGCYTAMFVTILISVATSIEGYDDGLKRYNPTAYYRLEGFFTQLFNLEEQYPYNYKLTVKWPAVNNKKRNPIFQLGKNQRSDVLFLEYNNMNQARLGIAHWGITPIVSKWIAKNELVNNPWTISIKPTKMKVKVGDLVFSPKLNNKFIEPHQYNSKPFIGRSVTNVAFYR